MSTAAYLVPVAAAAVSAKHVGTRVLVNRDGRTYSGGLSDVEQLSAKEERTTLVAGPGRLPTPMFGEAPVRMTVLWLGGTRLALMPGDRVWTQVAAAPAAPA